MRSTTVCATSPTSTRRQNLAWTAPGRGCNPRNGDAADAPSSRVPRGAAVAAGSSLAEAACSRFANELRDPGLRQDGSLDQPVVGPPLGTQTGDAPQPRFTDLEDRVVKRVEHLSPVARMVARSQPRDRGRRAGPPRRRWCRASVRTAAHVAVARWPRSGAQSRTWAAPAPRRATPAWSRARRTAVCVRSVSSASSRNDSPSAYCSAFALLPRGPRGCRPLELGQRLEAAARGVHESLLPPGPLTGCVPIGAGR